MLNPWVLKGEYCFAPSLLKYESPYVLLTCSARNDASRHMSGATPLGSQSTALLRRVGINSQKKKSILASFVSVCLLPQHCFGEIWYWKLLWKYVDKFRVWLQSDSNVGHFTWRFQCGGVGDSRTNYFVAGRQCNENPFLGFHGKPRRFSVVYSYL